jgi:hypothetical protein
MALLQKFKTSDVATGTQVILEDVTGNYSSENVGGYGAPNEPRTSFALWVLATHNLSDEAEELSLSGYIPETADTWTVPNLLPEINQWIQFKIYNVPLKSLVVSPVTGQIAHNESSDQLEKYNGSAWDVISDEDISTELTESSVDFTEANHGKASGYFKVYNRLTKLLYLDCNCPSSDLRRYKAEVREQLEGFQLLFCEKNYTLAQQIAEEYQDRIYQLLEID